jgi:hypothetical protein
MKILNTLRFGTICFVITSAASYVQAQGVRVPSHANPPVQVAVPAPTVAQGGARAGAAALTAPSNLTATPATNAQIDLNWTAAAGPSGTTIQYQIERCQGLACSSYAKIDTSATTTYRDSGLMTAESYSYRVRAADASGSSLSSYSNNSSAQAPPASAPAAGLVLTAPSNLAATPTGNTQIALSWTAASETVGTITSYHIERCQGVGCTNFAQIASSPTTTYIDIAVMAEQAYSYRLRATDISGNPTSYSNPTSAAFPPASKGCWLFPTRLSCMNFGSDIDANINTFYSTDGTFSYFNQIKSIYNGASGAATVSADLWTFNMRAGTQVTVGTNVQAGSSGTTTVSSGTVPTLSANGAGQATQNMLYGGSFVISALYPVLAIGASKANSPDNFGILLDVIGKEGADIQNFKSGTSISVNSPPTHTSVHMEGYLQYNSTHLATSASNYMGALFIGGSYGYDYTSHGYARDYGFGNRVQNDLGQVSVGILINGIARIAVSRAFGPSQTYIDSTSKTQTTVNNFKAWSFGITYQSPAPAAK